jgi:hypothetical protein
MGWFGKPRKPPHPNLRELNGLRWCITAWRRAVIEHWYQDGEDSHEVLSEKLSALGWYNHAAGGADEFTEFVLQVPVGELDPSLLLGAHWRAETATAIAWALGLVAVIPPMPERSDSATLDGFFPLDDRPPAIAAARLRDHALIAAELAAWKQNLVLATANRERAGPADEAAALEFSRAYERTRGLAWVLSDAAQIDDTPMD